MSLVPIFGGFGSSGGGDPHWANVSLLIQGEESNGSTTFTDSSDNAFTVSTGGDPAWSNTEPIIGATSIRLDGNDHLEIADDADFEFQGGDFTVEAFVNFSATSGANRYVVTKYDSGTDDRSWAIFYRDNSSEMVVTLSSGGTSGTTPAYFFGFTPATGTTYHMALVRDGNTVRFFVDGVEQTDSGPNSATFSSSIHESSVPVRIGANAANGTPGDYFTGFGNLIRITKGVARYTSNFTSPDDFFPTSA